MPTRATVNNATYQEMRRLSEKAHAEAVSLDWITARMEGKFSYPLLDTMVKHSVRLGDLIDTNVLVNRHILRQEGIDPDSIRVFLFGSYPTSSAHPEQHLLILNNEALGGANQDLYVLLAHELTHFKQFLSGQVTRESATEQAEGLDYHAERPVEMEAIFWETQQGTKFGWGREEVRRFHKRLYPPGVSSDFAMERQMRARAAMPVLSRRPVAVRSHRRRW